MKNRSMLGALFVAALSTGGTAPPGRLLIPEALGDPARPLEDRRADALRKPAETLAFAGVRPGMIIGEFYPGGGYFTRLLSHMVGPSGHVYGIENSFWRGSVAADQALLAERRWNNVSMTAAAFGTVKFPRPLDIAWLTQNYHDLKITAQGKVDTIAFDRAVYAALKPGGIYLVVDHQGAPEMSERTIARLHRIDRDTVVREVTSAGFTLVGEAPFLRNAADDHQRPIFDSSIRGHTDQYVLKFVRPDESWLGKVQHLMKAMPVLIPARN